MSKREPEGARVRERRRRTSEMKMRPPSSPANFLILVVIGVLGVSALAAALMGTGTEETTPHGQVLTSLQRVAEAQEERFRSTGAFAEWIHDLEVEVPGEVRLGLARGTPTEWEATASHPIGLICIMEGELRQGRPHRGPPMCYTTGTP
jgi:hypothetical protein